MALFKARIKRSGLIHGIRLEQGMEVDFPSTSISPLSYNRGKDVGDAFMRKYGIDLQAASLLNSGVIEIIKIG